MRGYANYIGAAWTTGSVASICFLFAFQTGLHIEKIKQNMTNGFGIFDAIRPGVITVTLVLILIATVSAGLGWFVEPTVKRVLGHTFVPLFFSTIFSLLSGYLCALLFLHSDTAWLVGGIMLGHIIIAIMVEVASTVRRTGRNTGSISPNTINMWIDRLSSPVVAVVVITIIVGNLLSIWLSQGQYEVVLAISGIALLTIGSTCISACYIIKNIRPVQK